VTGAETAVRRLRSRSASEIGRGLVEAVKREGGNILRDDATVVVVVVTFQSLVDLPEG
jgi:hypothetical protein